MERLPNGALIVRTDAEGHPYYEAKWRRGGAQVKRRVGSAWLEPAAGGGWQARRGRVPEGLFDEKRATVRMAALVAEHDATAQEIERGQRERRERGATVRELAAAWLEYVWREKGAKPATLQDYGYLLLEPGTPHKRGPGVNAGRIMRALGDRPIANVTMSDVASFLRGLERAGMSPRSVNKHREVLSAMFSYAQREDTYALARNPVIATSKRRELPPAVLDFFEPEEIEALARAAEVGGHRGAQPYNLDPGEVDWREW
jgi:hypothetical protein